MVVRAPGELAGPFVHDTINEEPGVKVVNWADAPTAKPAAGVTVQFSNAPGAIVVAGINVISPVAAVPDTPAVSCMLPPYIEDPIAAFMLAEPPLPSPVAVDTVGGSGGLYRPPEAMTPGEFPGRVIEAESIYEFCATEKRGPVPAPAKAVTDDTDCDEPAKAQRNPPDHDGVPDSVTVTGLVPYRNTPDHEVSVWQVLDPVTV